MNLRLIALIGAVMIIALIAAGCGDSDDDDTTTASLTKAEFLKQGNAICSAGNREIEADFEAFAKENNLENKAPSDAQFEEIAESTLIPSVSKQVEELRALGVPSGEEDQVDTLLDNAEEAVEELEEDPGSLSGNEDPFADVNQEARAYGLTACGEE